ncbi:type II toxin-antitoxin system tRNA(fMet)-specific endonuclease VapC [Pseudaquabacterium terrae]|nr:type II toxin-antitoxin system VapC family toxin [Aquabacterium terrae]
MLDTDICIYAINERPPAVLRKLREHQPAGLGVSSITAAELHYGVARTGSKRNLEALRRFLATLEVSPFDAAAAELSGSLRAWLASQGTPIGPYDTLIAAHAHAVGATLVSNNLREFERVPGLRLENWAA